VLGICLHKTLFAVTLPHGKVKGLPVGK
jgi:hypothetical protein